MQSATSSNSVQKRSGDTFDRGKEQETSSFCLRNDRKPGVGELGSIRSAPSVASSRSPDSMISKLFPRETSNLKHEVEPDRNHGQVVVTYGGQGPKPLAECREENFMDYISNTPDVDSLSRIFAQFDLMRNVRQQLQLQDEHTTVKREGKAEKLQDDDACLQQQPLLNVNVNEPLKKPTNALQPSGIGTSTKYAMEEPRDSQDRQDLRHQRSVSMELELRWYKHKVLQLRARIKTLVHEKISMGKQIEKMNRILSNEGLSKPTDQQFLPGTSSSFTPSIFTPNPVRMEKDLEINKSQVDSATQDNFNSQEIYYTSPTNSALARSWQALQGDHRQPVVKDLQSPTTQGPSVAASQASQEVPVKGTPHLDLPKAEFDPALKNGRNFSIAWKGKSIASGKSTTAPGVYDHGETSSLSSGSNKDSSPAGSPSPLRRERLFWRDVEKLTGSRPTKDISHQGQIKTELCRNWEEYGNCPYAEHCKFAHGVGELRPVLRHPLYKTQICRMLLQGKKCIYDHRCHFRHALTQEEVSLIARFREYST